MWVSDLFPEFFTNTLIILVSFSSTRTITTGLFQTLPDEFYHLLIFVQLYCHIHHFLEVIIDVVHTCVKAGKLEFISLTLQLIMNNGQWTIKVFPTEII